VSERRCRHCNTDLAAMGLRADADFCSTPCRQAWNQTGGMRRLSKGLLPGIVRRLKADGTWWDAYELWLKINWAAGSLYGLEPGQIKEMYDEREKREEGR
jgi:hypothetical protein